MTPAPTPPPTAFDRHGYFFARLPKNPLRRPLQRLNEAFRDGLVPARSGPATAGSPSLWTGVLTCRLLCITPVHVGSGSYRPEPGATGSVVADIIRDPAGTPVIPGSSLKGSFRALAEAASKSCLLLRSSEYQEKRNELPKAVLLKLEGLATSSRGHVPSKVPVQVPTRALEPCRIPAGTRGANPHGVQLCPCCAVYGALLYRGRVNFSEAVLVPHECLRPEESAKVPSLVYIPPRFGGRPHRLAQPGRSRPKRFGQKIGLDIQAVLGRRFYPNWDPHGLFQTALFNWQTLDSRLPNQGVLNQAFFNAQVAAHEPQWREGRFREPHDVLPIGSALQFQLQFTALQDWELGMLLTALGWSARFDWLPKVGGAKGWGLGTVLVLPERLVLRDHSRGALLQSPQDLAGPVLLTRIGQYVTAFEGSPAFHEDGARDLHRGLSLDLAAEHTAGRLDIITHV